MTGADGPMIVVSAGTYHLPFDRLSDWMERWASTHPGVRLVVQHGPSRPVAGAENVGILPYDDLLELCRRADAVVLQGGAGGVMDMRALGVVPVVVPRVPGHGEVVDDHQLIFSAEMAAVGLLRRATSYEELDRTLADVLTARPEPTAALGTPGADRVRERLTVPPPAVPWSRRARRGAATVGWLVSRVLRRTGR